MVKKKNKRLLARICSLMGVLVVLCSMALPAFGATHVEDDTPYSPLMNFGFFDTVIVADETVVPYAYSTIDYDGSTSSVDYQFYSPIAEDTEVVSWSCATPVIDSGVYYLQQTVSVPGSNWQKVTFSNSQPFYISRNDWNLFAEKFSVSVPSQVYLDYSISLSVMYPVDGSNGGYVWVPTSGTFEGRRASGKDMTFSALLSFLSQYDGFDAAARNFEGLYITSIELTLELYDFENYTDLGGITFTMPYQDSVNFGSALDFIRKYPRENTIIYVTEDLSADEIGSFLASASSGFFDAEIIPGISLGGILAVIIGVMIFALLIRRG